MVFGTHLHISFVAHVLKRGQNNRSYRKSGGFCAHTKLWGLTDFWAPKDSRICDWLMWLNPSYCSSLMSWDAGDYQSHSVLAQQCPHWTNSCFHMQNIQDVVIIIKSIYCNIITCTRSIPRFQKWLMTTTIMLIIGMTIMT